MVIFLNGPSSSGKTSLARALQSRWSSPLIYLSLDSVMAQLPFAFTGTGASAAEGFALTREQKAGENATQVRVGVHGYRLNALAADYAAAICRAGYDVVIDYVLLDRRMLDDFAQALADVPVLLVGLTCGIDTLRARNERRAERAAGLSEAQAARVHFCRACYDLALDSTGTSPPALADRILKHIGAEQITLGIGSPPSEDST